MNSTICRIKKNHLLKKKNNNVIYFDNKKINNIIRTITGNCKWNFNRLKNNNSDKCILFSVNGLAEKKQFKINNDLKNKFIEFCNLILNKTSEIIPYNFKYTNNYSKSVLDFNFVNSKFLKKYLNYSSIYGIAFPPGTNPWVLGSNKNIRSDGNVFINFDYFNNSDITLTSYLHLIVLHELGHAFGLYHTHDNGGNTNKIAGINHYNKYSQGTLKQNNFIYTVMTYNDKSSNYSKKNKSNGYVKNWMAYDIAALQYLYGKSKNSITNDIYYINENNWECINDSNGINTISGQKSNKGVTINLNNANLDNDSQNAGGYITKLNNVDTAGLLISKNSVITNAIGSNYNDIIYSNNRINIIRAESGNDIIYATNGNIFCGNGNDKIIVKNIHLTKKLYIDGYNYKNLLIINLNYGDMKKIFVNQKGIIIIVKKKLNSEFKKGNIRIKNIKNIKFLDKNINTNIYLNKASKLKKKIFIKR
jgi:hypothetical protein